MLTVKEGPKHFSGESRMVVSYEGKTGEPSRRGEDEI
jgi:hypothetical protein